jgi:prepilin-type N-terminal cleavage/methylation domain-containing protein
MTAMLAQAFGSRGQAGFTLMEVLIVLTLACGAIILGVALDRTVGRATQGGRAAEHDWVTEQFLRRQAIEAQRPDPPAPIITRERAHEFGFVTRRSAQWGEDGPPVLAVWRYDSGQGVLRYREAALPPWWPEDRPSTLPDYDALADTQDRGVWEGRIFSDIDKLEFSYWDERRRVWDAENPDSTALTPIVRLKIDRGSTERVFSFATRGALSFSLSSGLSPAAP